MASGTISGSTSNEYIASKIEWTSTPTKSTNSSKVTATLYYKRTNSGYTTYGLGSFGIYIGGMHGGAKATLTITENAWVKAVTVTKTIAHNDDGTMTIKIYGVGNIGGTTLTSTNCSAQVKLDTIPRESSFTLSTGQTSPAGNPVVTVNDVNSLKVNISSHSPSFEHHVRFNFGSKDVEGDLVYNSMTYVPKMEDWLQYIKSSRNTLALSDANAPSVEVRTISEEGEQVGETVRKRFDIQVASSSATVPTPSMTIKPKNPSSFPSKFAGMYIQGKSQVSIDLSESTAKYGADIVTYKSRINSGSWKTGETVSSETLSQSGTNTVSGQVTDSRGLSTTQKKTITVVAYSKPSIVPIEGENAIICKRSDSDESKVELKARVKYSCLTGDKISATSNSCTLRYRYKTESDSTYSAWVNFSASQSAYYYNYNNATIALFSASPLVAYTVQISASDTVGESDVVQITIPTTKVTMHLGKGGNRIGFGRYVDSSEDEGVYSDLTIHGGGVDNLTLGTRLVASSTAPIDLNDFKTVGNYYSPSADSSKYITNAPYKDGGFSLIVREIQSENMIRQELFYGRSNWQRHWNGSTQTWSDWLRYLMTDEDTSTAVDFVTEIGVSNVDDSDPDLGYWRYRKWKSGAVDMNGLFRVTPVTENTLGTAGVYYSQVIYIDLPFSVANFQFTGSGASYHVFVGNANSVDGNDKQIRLRLYRFTDFESLSGYKVYIRIIASGKLK